MSSDFLNVRLLMRSKAFFPCEGRKQGSGLTLPFPMGPGLLGHTHSAFSDLQNHVLGDTALPLSCKVLAHSQFDS